MQLFNDAWLHFTNNKFPNSACIEKILDQPIFWNLFTKLHFYSDNPYFYCIQKYYPKILQISLP